MEENRTPELKLFEHAPYDTYIRIGILPLFITKKYRSLLHKSMGKDLGDRLIYKQNLFSDPSQASVSWHHNHDYVRHKFFKRMSRYMYYPSSYAKNLFGWNIFDYLPEWDKKPIVRLTRMTQTAEFSNIDTIDWFIQSQSTFSNHTTA